VDAAAQANLKKLRAELTALETKLLASAQRAMDAHKKNKP
jgi:hypothetical protein